MRSRPPPCSSPAGRPDGRRRGPVAARRRPAATTRACASTTRTGRARPAGARSSRIGWSTPAGRWYLVAWDTDRDDWRTFRVDRLRPYLPLGGRFTPRPLSDEEVQALVARGVPPAARRYQARVLVHAPAATIAERIGPWVGTVEARRDRCILDTGADNLEILAVHLGMLEADFTVTEPPELVTHMLALGERYTRAVRV